MSYFFRALGKYFSIEGRASRKELWMFLLFEIIFGVGTCAVDIYLGTDYAVPNDPNNPLGTVSLLYCAFLFIPYQTLQVRRLHDVNKSGFWWIVSFIPIIGLYPNCLMFFAESNRGPNKYGDVPDNVRGYQPNVYVNVNMNQAPDGSYEASYERHEEYESSTQDYSHPHESHRVHVNKRRPEPRSEDNYVYEESTYTDFEKVSPEVITPHATDFSESFETGEPYVEASEATSKSHSWRNTAIGIAIALGLILFIVYFVSNTLEKNAESPKEKVELLDSKNEEALIADFLSDKNAGYASDKFHSDTPLIRMSMSDKEATFGVTRVYDTSYHLKVSNDSIEAKWYDYYTRVSVTPKKKGISFICFSNELNDETFRVMVVVE